MVRPKQGTKEGDLATNRWRKTMEERYGGEEGFHQKMREVGRIGGRNSRGGGFASNKIGKDGLTGAQRAKIAGKKGGRKSTRLGISNGQGRQANKDINEMERILEEESGRN